MKILGYEKSSGNFNGINYNNVYLYCADAIRPEKGKGVKVYRNKVKADLFNDWCQDADLKDWQDCIGCNVRFMYDSYGNIVELQSIQ